MKEKITQVSNDMFLRVSGKHLLDRTGKQIRLRGIGLGGWMNMENFITGYPASEQGQRQALQACLGTEKYEFFFDKFLEYFFTVDDARYLRSLGMNVVRLPVNYRHFENDDAPGVIIEAGFKHLDRVIDLCAREGIYTIIDLHSAPGGQNEDWHCDNETHKPLFWQHRDFQDRTVRLWEAFALRYRGNPAVAGYNFLNEPNDVTRALIRPFYARIIDAVRAIDPEHVIFLDGNHYASEFAELDPPFENVVYAFHQYPAPGATGAPSYPGRYYNQWFDKERLQKDTLDRCQYLLDKKVPIWAGEFGPHYCHDAVVDAMRRQVAADQLASFDAVDAHWCLWTYKDIGVMGLVHLTADSAWMKRLAPVLAKKARLAVDGAIPGDAVQVLTQPLEETMAREFPGYNPQPWGVGFQISRLVRGILFAEPLLAEFAAVFADMSLAEIDEMMKSFLLARCVKREELAQILQTACKS